MQTRVGEKAGKTYGLGDGTGNIGCGSKDGIGYGSTLNR